MPGIKRKSTTPRSSPAKASGTPSLIKYFSPTKRRTVISTNIATLALQKKSKFRLQKCMGSKSVVDTVTPFSSKLLFEGAWLGRNMSAKAERNSNSKKIDLNIFGHKNTITISRKSVEITGIEKRSLNFRTSTKCNGHWGVAIRRFKKVESNCLKANPVTAESSTSSSASDIPNTTDKDEKKGLEVIKPSTNATLNVGDILIFDHFAKRRVYQFKLIISSDYILEKNAPNNNVSKRASDIMVGDNEIEIIATKGRPLEILGKGIGNDDDLDQIVLPSTSRKHKTNSPVKKRPRRSQQKASDSSELDDVEVINVRKKTSLGRRMKTKSTEIVDLTPAESIQSQASSLWSPSHSPAKTDSRRDRVGDDTSKEITVEFGVAPACKIVSDDSSGSIISSGDKSEAGVISEGSTEKKEPKVALRNMEHSMTELQSKHCIVDSEHSIPPSPLTNNCKQNDSVMRATKLSPSKSLERKAEVSSTTAVMALSSVDTIKELNATEHEVSEAAPPLGGRRSNRLETNNCVKSEESVGSAVKAQKRKNEAVSFSDEKRIGSRVYAEYCPGDGGWYWGKIRRIHKGNKFEVLFDDGDVKNGLSSKKVLSERAYFETFHDAPPPCIRSCKASPQHEFERGNQKRANVNDILKHPGKISIPMFSPDLNEVICTKLMSSDAEPNSIDQSIANSFYRTLVSSEPNIGYQLLMNCLVCCAQIPPDDILSKIFHAAVFGPICEGIKLVDLNKHRKVVDYAMRILCFMNSYWNWEVFLDAVNAPLNTDVVDLWEQSAITFEFIAELFRENEQLLNSCDDVRFLLKQTVRAVKSFYSGHENAFYPSMRDDCERLEAISTVTHLCKAYCNLAAKLAQFIRKEEGLCEQDMLYLCLAGVDSDCDLFFIFEDTLLCH
mmetsp:Transcript_33183/g.48007  ORF Transcript_33183/g.48007 Transcript_33183/m.48007 type:complete len:894 (-) Transcript_33183:44-2725(-)